MTTATAPLPAPVYRLAQFELRPAERALLAEGAPVRLGGRAFDLLVALLERRDRVVGKGELLDIVWPNLVVEENNLQAQIAALRKLMGPEAIATVPGRGYRLTLAVHPAWEQPGGAAPAQPPALAADALCAAPPDRHNLPRSVEPLIGREREMVQLQALVAQHRLVTVTGPGGVGKSRLAIDGAWAFVGQFADGVWLVQLAALADPALVPAAITAALGVDVAPSGDALPALKHQLGDRRLLLVLDNCEHVIDAVASVLQAVLSAAPGVHVLVSSQELIGIGGEHVLRLPSLGVPAEPKVTAEAAMTTGAVQLFVARARAADPGFVFDDGAAPAVAAICRRLDGIALAIEMAAARTPLLGVEGLSARLDERFRVLTAGRRTALPRHRTLQATLDWSYGHLSLREQAVFRRLGVFAGPFSLEAAAAVAADAGEPPFEVIESLSGLCDKSLAATDASAGEVRYRLLETARAYALERLAHAEETASVTASHAGYYRRFFEACFDDWTLMSDAAFRARYGEQIDNLRLAVGSAFAQGDGDTAVALAGSTAQVWVGLSLYAEADALLQRAMACLTPATPATLEADLWSAVAVLHARRDQRKTILAAQRAADLYRRLGNPLRLGCALRSLGCAYAVEADETAESVLREARPLLECAGRPRLLALSHAAFATLHAGLGRPEESIRESQAAIDLWRAAGAEGAVIRTLGSLADQVWAQGDLDRAIGLVLDVLERHRQSPFADRLSRLYASANLFAMLVERGHHGEAQALGRQLLPELCELQIAHGWTDHYASFLVRAGRSQDAVRLVGWSDALRLSKGLKRQPNEQRARDAVVALAGEREPAGSIELLLAAGAALSAEQAHRLALP